MPQIFINKDLKSHIVWPKILKYLFVMRFVYFAFALIMLLLTEGSRGDAIAQGYRTSSSFGYTCGVILPQKAEKVAYTGGCVDGLADGWGEMDVFQNPFGRVQYQGYFRQGYPLKKVYFNGTFVQLGDHQIYFYTPQDFGELFLPAKAQDPLSWDLCAAPAVLFPNPAIPDARTRAHAYYTTLCDRDPWAFVTLKNIPRAAASTNTMDRLPALFRSAQR